MGIPIKPIQANNCTSAYLGGGVYARWDGFQFWLAPTHAQNYSVALEPEILQQLTDFARIVYQQVISQANREQETPDACADIRH